MEEIGKQTVTISFFWALESLFVTEKYFVAKKMIENSMKKTPPFI